MIRTLTLPAAVVAALAGALATLSPQAANAAAADCQIGAYRSPAGADAVAITQRDDGFRYTFVDGRFGAAADPAGLVACAPGAVTVKAAGGATETWPRIGLKLTPTRFDSDGVALAGQLVETEGAGPKTPLVVFVHGSESTGSVGRTSYPYLLAAQGVSSFVFDKRGAGQSGGAYTQNFPRLAKDVAAASAEARRLAAGRFGRFGLFGGSQGGWVAPLAATPAHAQFLAIGFGLVLTPLEEDSEQVFDELRGMSYGPDVIDRAREVTDATGAVMSSHFQSGYDRLARVKAAYGGEPWFGRIKGEFTGDLLAASEADLRANGRAKFDKLDIDWTGDPMKVLRGLSIPQIWVLAGKDREAPGGLTHERLATLRKEGKPIEVYTFPDTDHGIMEFVQAPDGTRRNVRIADGYYRLLADWMKGGLKPPYGKARAD